MIEPNGCGACDGFWRWFKPPHHKFFEQECNTHDTYYDLGKTNIDRLVADLILLQDMKIRVKTYFQGRKPMSKNWYLFLCYIYFIGLRVFGTLPINRVKTNKQKT